MFNIPGMVLIIEGIHKIPNEQKVVTSGQIRDGSKAWQKNLEGQNFDVEIMKGEYNTPTWSEITAKIADYTKRKLLHAIVFVGHSGMASMIVRSDDGAKARDLEVDDIAKKLSYRLGFASIQSCSSWYDKEWYRLVSDKGGAYGSKKLCEPTEIEALELIERPKSEGGK